MSLGQYRRELQQERERRARTNKSLSDLDRKLGRQADQVRKASTLSSIKSRQRELDQLRDQRTKAQGKLSDHDKKINRFEDRVSKAEQREQTTRDAAQKRSQQSTDREQAQIRDSLDQLEGTTSELTSRVTDLERAPWSN